MFSSSLKATWSILRHPQIGSVGAVAVMLTATVHVAPLLVPDVPEVPALQSAAFDVPAGSATPWRPSTADLVAAPKMPTADWAPLPKPRPYAPAIVGQVGPLKLLNLAAVRTGEAPVHRALHTELPAEYHEIATVDGRKGAFFSVVLPLVLIANEEVLADRRRLTGIVAATRRGTPVTTRDQAWLADLADRYNTDPAETDELLRRVDMVPPALALAQAAEESGWGQSRFARQGNALFGEWTWTEGEGIVPAGRPEGATYAVRSFDSLLDSVRSYLQNLNTNNAYADLRDARAGMRAARQDLDAAHLAGSLQRYSQRGDEYVESLRIIIRANDLGAFSSAQLAPAGA